MAPEPGAPAAEPRRTRLSFGLTVGLCAAFLLFGGWLTKEGLWSVGREVDCSGMTGEACIAEQVVWDGTARQTLGLGIALLALGAGTGLALWFTERRRAANG